MNIDGKAERTYVFTFTINQEEFDVITLQLDEAIGNGELHHKFWGELYNKMAEYYED